MTSCSGVNPSSKMREHLGPDLTVIPVVLRHHGRIVAKIEGEAIAHAKLQNKTVAGDPRLKPSRAHRRVDLDLQTLLRTNRVPVPVNADSR